MILLQSYKQLFSPIILTCSHHTLESWSSSNLLLFVSSLQSCTFVVFTIKRTLCTYDSSDGETLDPHWTTYCDWHCFRRTRIGRRTAWYTLAAEADIGLAENRYEDTGEVDPPHPRILCQCSLSSCKHKLRYRRYSRGTPSCLLRPRRLMGRMRKNTWFCVNGSWKKRLWLTFVLEYTYTWHFELNLMNYMYKKWEAIIKFSNGMVTVKNLFYQFFPRYRLLSFNSTAQ